MKRSVTRTRDPVMTITIGDNFEHMRGFDGKEALLIFMKA